jgi:enterochelin esterase family protein
LNAADGTKTEIAQESVSGLELSPDGSLLYASQGSKNRVISIDVKSGEVKTVAEGVKPNDWPSPATDSFSSPRPARSR